MSKAVIGTLRQVIAFPSADDQEALQAITDHQAKFLDIFVGYPGSVHDARVLKNSPAIKTRFAPVLESREALLAALTLPKFKVRWIGGAERREAARALLIAECRTLPHVAEPAENKNREVAAHSSANEKDFFAFDEEEDAMAFSADSEVLEYMRSGSEIETLNRFPRVKAVFMKYNTATPSSAPVERLFSLGGLVLTPRRNRLSDKRFERLLLMRYNHPFSAVVE
ncbi:putative nuclease HARBI1 [Pimephales promelas]|nr:putative nuclease HARBI1 [Pimephales promelas]